MTTEYITIDGDRLDVIAHKAYGDSTKWREIIEANPDLAIMPVYPAGIRIIIPVDEGVDILESSFLPPWKQ